MALHELCEYQCNKFSESGYTAQKWPFPGEKPYICKNVTFVIIQACSSLFGNMKPLQSRTSWRLWTHEYMQVGRLNMKGALWKVERIENEAESIIPHFIHYIQTVDMIIFTADMDIVSLLLTYFSLNCEMGSLCCFLKSHNVIIIGLIPLWDLKAFFNTFYMIPLCY